MSKDKTSTSKINDQFLQKQTIEATPEPHSKDDKLEDRKQPSNRVESSKPSLHDKKNANLQKMLKTKNAYCSKNLSKENKKKMIEDIDSKNLMRIMARPLEYLFGSTLGVIMRMIL